MNNNITPGKIISWIFSLIFFAIGVINVFYGNDPGYGIFIILLSFVFFPPVNTIIMEKTGFAVPAVLKIVLGLLILWTAVGVGELFNKVDMMILGS